MDQEFKTKVFHLLKQQTETVIALETRVGELVEANNAAFMLLAELEERVTTLESAPRLVLGEDCPEEVEEVVTRLATEWSSFQSSMTEQFEILRDHVRAIDDRLGSKLGRTIDVRARMEEIERDLFQRLPE